MTKVQEIFQYLINDEKYDFNKKVTYKRCIKLVLTAINSNSSVISWKFIREEILKSKTYCCYKQMLILWTLFAVKLDCNGLLNGELRGLFEKNQEAIIWYVTGTFKNKEDVLLAENFNPTSIFLIPIKNKSILKATCSRYIRFIEELTIEASDFIKLYLSSMNDQLMYSRWRTGSHIIFPLMLRNDCLYLDLEKYNDSTFMYHLNLIFDLRLSDNKSKNEKLITDCAGELINFYSWIQTQIDNETRKQNFIKFTSIILKYLYLTSCLRKGFKVVNYSIYEHPPKFDKWIINPQSTSLHQNAQADRVVRIDFSGIQNLYLRKWIKECFWFDDSHNIYTRPKEYSSIFNFASLIDKKFNANELPKILSEDILFFKALCVGENTTEATVARKLSLIKYFLNYINDRKYLQIDHLLFRLLVHHDSDQIPYKETYTKEEIKLLLSAYKDNYEHCANLDNQLLYKLYYYIIAIQSVSEMRTSTILNLKINCLVKTLTRNGHDEYKVVVQSKTSGRSNDEYNITHYVKNLIDEAISITANLRKETMDVEKDYIFIFRRYVHKAISIIRQDGISEYHCRICKKYGIKVLRIGAIRNYYQQQVSEYVAKNNHDVKLIEKLSKHSNNVHIQHYDAVDIKDFCGRFYRVEIGSIDLKGRVEEKNEEPEKNLFLTNADIVHQKNVYLKEI